MLTHCKAYRYYNKTQLPAVLATLLGALCCYAGDTYDGYSRPQIALLGDSMTWIGGDSCQNNSGWSHYLLESGIAESISVFARSGATWTNTSATRQDTLFYSELLHDDNVVYNQMLRMIGSVECGNISTPEFIVIFAGANDAWFASRRPGIYETDDTYASTRYPVSTPVNTVTSLAGSVRLVCDVISKSIPSADVILVTPLQMSKVDADTVHHISDIIESAVADRGVSVWRADNDVAITHDSEYPVATYTYDGVHTNPKGASMTADYIISRLNEYIAAKNIEHSN